ncbi:hypothetical protein GCM10022223_59670 [Kineosporia mesophila]|uniref:Uncharacterized protein n=1 Tax=Kineosporia mesophila TaxID=566012 RepID=A0ABP7AJ24_9ACTN|nr:hypothetical protein [Kineosporia mesophila]MCD5352422.1 hypothetical protein [Kineosporia mesophila]
METGTVPEATDRGFRIGGDEFAVRHLGEAAERPNARADEALHREKNRRRERDQVRRTRRP